MDQALAEGQAAPEEAGPALVAAGSAVIGAQDAVKVTGNRPADLGLFLGHSPSLA